MDEVFTKYSHLSAYWLKPKRDNESLLSNLFMNDIWWANLFYDEEISLPGTFLVEFIYFTDGEVMKRYKWFNI